MATGGALAESASVKRRPSSRGTASAAKNPGVTDDQGEVGSAPPSGTGWAIRLKLLTSPWLSGGAEVARPAATTPGVSNAAATARGQNARTAGVSGYPAGGGASQTVKLDAVS